MNSKIYIGQLPIASASTSQKSAIISLVEKILAAPESPNVPTLEKQIDALVYDLYGLTKDETAIVEQHSS